MLTGGVTTTYTCDVANQLTSFQDNTGTTNFTFDANGNQTLKIAVGGGRTTNTWDYENRLTKVVLPAGTRNTFVYDADGKRVQKQDSTGTTKPIWDLFTILEETDSGDTTQVVYTQAPTRYGELVSQLRAGAAQFYLFDGLGSVDRLTDTTPTVTDSYVYQAFGNIQTSSGSSINPFRYNGETGYYLDTDLPQLYVRARHYSPSVGRWLSPDPLGLIQGPNLYLYLRNSVVGRSDPSGMCKVCGVTLLSGGGSGGIWLHIANTLEYQDSYFKAGLPHQLAAAAWKKRIVKGLTDLNLIGEIFNEGDHDKGWFPPTFKAYGFYRGWDDKTSKVEGMGFTELYVVMFDVSEAEADGGPCLVTWWEEAKYQIWDGSAWKPNPNRRDDPARRVIIGPDFVPHEASKEDGANVVIGDLNKPISKSGTECCRRLLCVDGPTIGIPGHTPQRTILKEGTIRVRDAKTFESQVSFGFTLTAAIPGGAIKPSFKFDRYNIDYLNQKQ
jgi:RHS repeat-associated protein